jgi:hypothetical protein
MGLQRIEIIVPWSREEIAEGDVTMIAGIVVPNVATVEILPPRIGRVIDPKSASKLRIGDIVILSRDPSESDAPPTLEKVLPRRNPVETKLPYWTWTQRHRLVALAAAVAGEVVDVDEFGEESTRECPLGSITITHPENIDLNQLAEAAGLADTDPDYSEDYDGDGESEMGERDEQSGSRSADAA